jgi:putative transcriptional regulator
LKVTGYLPDTIVMRISQSLSNHFLIAMPALDDPNFHHTTTYICEHDEDGALGVVINRPLNMRIIDILKYMDIEPGSDEISSRPVYMGGPVQSDRGFVLHEPAGDWEATLKVTDKIGITSSRDILQAMAAGEGPDKAIVTLGYAGWGAGQLEQELAANTWLSGPASSNIVFDTPSEERWMAAAALLGVDLNLISSDTGHA